MCAHFYSIVAMEAKKDGFLRWADLFTRFNAQANRRDKWYRLAQYISRFIVLHSTDLGLGKMEVIMRLKKLESALADSRKLYRIFGSVDFLYNAIELYRIPGKDRTINSMFIIANLAKGLWLFQDHFLWLGKIGLLQVNSTRLSRGGAWCWAIALVCLIIRDLKMITNIEQELGPLRAAQREQSPAANNTQATASYSAKEKEWRTAQIELLRDCLDLALPLSTLGRVGPKLAAACGVVSTFVTIKQEWFKLG